MVKARLAVVACALAAVPVFAALAEAPAAERLTLPAGSVLRPVASEVAPPLATLPAATEVEVVERDGRWLRVAWGETVGWVDPEAEPEGAAPPDAEPLAEQLAAAREALGDGAAARPLGPFTLLTDVEAARVDPLGALAAEVAAAYGERYGLPVPGGDGGVVVLFGREADFRAFADRFTAGDGVADHGLAGQTRGRLAALHVGGRSREQLSRLLVHELVHLLNRSALVAAAEAEALPPWLDEGLAGDLELYAVTAEGRLGASEPARRDVELRGRPDPYGPLILLPRLAGDALVGRLEGVVELTAFDRAAFLEPLRGSDRYALAAFWVRYLLTGEGGAMAAPFRAWLATRAAGGEAGAAALFARLEEEAGRDPERLDAGFRRWLVDQARRLGLDAERR